MQCKFCLKDYSSIRSKSQHEWRCDDNPNRKITQNQYTKAKRLGLPRPEISEKTRLKLAAGASKQIKSDGFKERHSISMKLAVKNNPDSYSVSRIAGRRNKIDYDGITFDSPWEVNFYAWGKEKKIQVERNSRGFPYTWKGERTYFPDFYLPELDLYVEVKGYQSERCSAKISQFTESLVVLKWE